MAGGRTICKALFGIFAILGIFLDVADAYLEAKTFMFAAFDNSVSVAVDGVMAQGLPQYTTWPTVYSVPVPPMAKVITVVTKARTVSMFKLPSPSALLSFLANTTLSYDNWKCATSTPPTATWPFPNFDDSLWDPAPVGNPTLVSALMLLFQEDACTECDPAAKWVGDINIIAIPPKVFYCRIHLPYEQAPTTNPVTTVSPGTIRPQVNAPEFVFRVDKSNTNIPYLGGCIRRVRSRISCARICTQQKEFCEGFQHGGPDELCCPMNTDAMQNGVRKAAVGYNIWRLVLY